MSFANTSYSTIKEKPIFEHEGYLYILNKESSNKVIVEEQLSLGSNCLGVHISWNRIYHVIC